MRGWLELLQPASDLGHLLLHLDRRVVSDANRQQPQDPVAQLGRLALGREVDPPERIRVIGSGHAGMIPARPDASWNPLYVERS